MANYSERIKLLGLLKRPVITEKSTELNEELNQYTFYVDMLANKIELAKAFEMAFPNRKVTKVRLIRVPGEKKRSGKRQGRTPDRRKAIFSITGEPIELLAGGV